MKNLIPDLLSAYTHGKHSLIKKLQHSSYPIYIFGDSEYALVVKAYLVFNSLRVEGNIVSKVEDLYLNGYKFDDLDHRYHIVIGMASQTKAELILNKFTKKNCVSVDYFALNPFYNLDNEMIRSSQDRISSVFNSLNDINSQEILSSYLKMALSNDITFLKPTTPQYFPKYMELSQNEIVVDGGAYTGDTLAVYVNIYKHFKEYHAFEPSTFNFNKLSSFSQLQDNIFLNNKGLGLSNTKLLFHDEDSESSTSSFVTSLFNSEKLKEVEIVRLDDYIQNVSFIKLDIEGAELDALIGSASLITKFKPKIAVCIYHKFEHLWQILDLLKSLRDDYRFSIGYHSTPNILTELVLYAY